MLPFVSSYRSAALPNVGPSSSRPKLSSGLRSSLVSVSSRSPTKPRPPPCAKDRSQNSSVVMSTGSLPATMFLDWNAMAPRAVRLAISAPP